MARRGEQDEEGREEVAYRGGESGSGRYARGDVAEREAEGPFWRRWWGERRLRKRAFWAGGAVVLLLLLIVAFRPQPVPVEVGEVTRGALEVTIDTDGVTRVVDRYQIGAPVAGRLQRLVVEEGDAVETGEVVARLAPLPMDPQATSRAEAAVAAAEARLTEANARSTQTQEAMEQARRYAERVRAVVAEGGMSVDALDRAELEVTSAEQEYAAAQARVSAARSELSAARAVLLDMGPASSASVLDVTSPAAGRVLRVHQQSERVVQAGTPLVDIGDAAGLEVVVDVLSTDAVQIEPGAPMRIEDWGGDRPLTGRVRRVEPSAFTRISTLGVEEQRVNVIGDLTDPPPELGDGYRVEARIVVWEADDVVKVPTSALFRSGSEQWAVFVVEGGQALERRVEIGRQAAAEAEVLDGLAPGERVILFPSDQLSEGTPVTPAST
ncbi:MAG: efflux RND transporter periplasmic adaptor subunit [Gemmatimonadota bacterium]